MRLHNTKIISREICQSFKKYYPIIKIFKRIFKQTFLWNYKINDHVRQLHSDEVSLKLKCLEGEKRLTIGQAHITNYTLIPVSCIIFVRFCETYSDHNSQLFELNLFRIEYIYLLILSIEFIRDEFIDIFINSKFLFQKWGIEISFIPCIVSRGNIPD